MKLAVKISRSFISNMNKSHFLFIVVCAFYQAKKTSMHFRSTAVESKMNQFILFVSSRSGYHINMKFIIENDVFFFIEDVEHTLN